MSKSRPPRDQTAASPAGRVKQLERKVRAGSQDNRTLDHTLRKLTHGDPARNAAVLPARLTARARRSLEQAQGLLARLHRVADQLGPDTNEPPGPFAVLFQQAVALAAVALRTAQTFPDSPGEQLPLCEGLEAVLAVAAERTARLEAALDKRGRINGHVTKLAAILTRLDGGAPVGWEAVESLADALWADARQGAALHFYEPEPAGKGDGRETARFVARHSLMVAQVIARVLGRDEQLSGRPLEPIAAALLHDVGMIRIPADIVQQPGRLTDEQRRFIEGHPRTGADVLARAFPQARELADAAAGHHERLDGTGYPAGLKAADLAPLTRLLAVCDVYAAQVQDRPHRAALDTRTVLADTLLLAEKGVLDRERAEWLLALSFYPVGAVVELADGAVGLVVATHLVRRDAKTLARPVLALLTDRQRRPLPELQHLDLNECDGHSIVRALSAAERRACLGRSHPALV